MTPADFARLESKLDLLLERLHLGPRSGIERRRVQCSTPGCRHKTQTGDSRCWHCRSGRKLRRNA